MSTQQSKSIHRITFGNVQDAVVDGIREQILSGELQPGDRLRQDELAEIFGVSTMPVREALRHLQAEGLVTFHPNRGATVSEISVEEYEEIYRIREELEVLAAHWAAQDFSRISVDELKRLLDEIEVAEAEFTDVPRRLSLVRDYTFTVLNASEKEHLLRIISSLWDKSTQYRHYFSQVAVDAIPNRIANYRRIYDACVAQDTDALVAAYRNLYAFGRENLIPRLQKHRQEKKKK